MDKQGDHEENEPEKRICERKEIWASVVDLWDAQAEQLFRNGHKGNVTAR